MTPELERFLRLKALGALRALADRWFPALPSERREQISQAAVQSLWHSQALGRSDPVDVAAVLRQHGLQVLRNAGSQKLEPRYGDRQDPGDELTGPDGDPLPGWVPAPPTRQSGDSKLGGPTLAVNGADT